MKWYAPFKNYIFNIWGPNDKHEGILWPPTVYIQAGDTDNNQINDFRC